MSDFEREQATWQSSLESKEESEKSAVRRWQKAERTLSSLQDQIERIESEAKEEKERHSEIVERMERRHAVERELGSAAGRLKGAAAIKKGVGGDDSGAPNVVSHFVKDILQDNANLQLGIVELREMLTNSNEEVETLRNQLQLHQPAEEDDRPAKLPMQREDLRGELNRANSQELHVHHHYHAPPTPKAQPLRRPKKKRIAALTPGHYTPSSGSSTPRSSFSHGSPTPTATILKQTAASLPQSIPARSRWSTQSSPTYQSLLISGPNSPQSTTNRTSSIFDRVFSDAGLDSSRPTTPDTEDPGSPVIAPVYTKRGAQSPFRNNSAPVGARGGLSSSAAMPTLELIMSVEELPRLESQSVSGDAIPEENENDWEVTSSPIAEATSSLTSPVSVELPNPIIEQPTFRPPLRRAASHESILSVSGADIHTLKSRPSQLLAPYGGRGITSQAVISGATAHAARPVAMSRPSANSRNMLSGVTADKRQPTAKSTPVGKKVGGWIFGRWGATPSASPATAAATTTTVKTNKSAPSNVATAKPNKPTSSSSTDSKAATAITIPKTNKPAGVASNDNKPLNDPQATPKKPKLRPPGINQSGPLLGFFPEVVKPPLQAPVMKSLDEEALRNILDGK